MIICTVDYSMEHPTEQTFLFSEEISQIEALLERLRQAETIHSRLDLLQEMAIVRDFITKTPFLKEYLKEQDPYEQFVLLALVALGQGPQVFQPLENKKIVKERLDQMTAQLLDVEKFYDLIGGIIGYHCTVLKCIQRRNKTSSPKSVSENRYIKPQGFDLTEESKELNQAVLLGIQSLPQIGMIFPVGGAGDRLNLLDEKTEEPLPAACLIFEGVSLLEGMIRDLQGWEYLHYQLFGEQITTPLYLMTSHEKNNHERIKEICREERFFGRPEKSFHFAIQPLVPVMSIEGKWCSFGPMKLALKPGGHGAIWKLAIDHDIFHWFEDQGRTHLVIRQINNPLASIDDGLIAFSGYGMQNQKAFGFASCQRLVHAAEGVDVLLEKKTKDGYLIGITNIEYPEFQEKGIEDVAEDDSSPYSAYPSNTNILFAEINRVREAAHRNPIPGMLINLKTKAPVLSPDGSQNMVTSCRLESTMQNIADELMDSMQERASDIASLNLQTYLTYNRREKTISVTKQSYVAGEQINGTPEGALYDLLKVRGELFAACGFEVPELGDVESYLRDGPGYVIQFHPALGPLHNVIKQKIRGGSLKKGSEVQLEIAQLDMEEVHIDGSLILRADALMGEKNHQEILEYSDRCGRCRLKNVRIQNSGINFEKTESHWKQQPVRKEELSITLHGNGEFFAENVTFSGKIQIEVPDRHRMIASQDGNRIHYQLERIDRPSWTWDFQVSEEGTIELTHKKTAAL